MHINCIMVVVVMVQATSYAQEATITATMDNNNTIDSESNGNPSSGDDRNTITATLTTTGITLPVSSLTEDLLNQARHVPSTPPLSTSTYHLTKLLQQEREAAIRLKKVAQTLQEAHQVLSRYLSSWEDLTGVGTAHQEFAHHPLHAYALTKHLALGWPALEESFTKLASVNQDVEWVLNRRNSSGVPSMDDLALVSSGLARLHDFYTLNLTLLAQATLTSALSPHPQSAALKLSVWDLEQIASHATAANIWGAGVDFLKAALERWNDNHTTSSGHLEQLQEPVNLHHLNKSLKKASRMHDQVLERKGRRSKTHSAHDRPLDKTLARKKKYHQGTQGPALLGQVGSVLQGQEQYRRICRGEDLRPVNVTSQLYCRYVRNGSPLYLIGPLRMEVYSLDPYVVVLEGVVTDREAGHLMKTAAGFLDKSSTLRTNGRTEVGQLRTSSTAWLWEHDSPHLPLLTHRIEQLLGVNAQQHVGAESYQVVNYGVGGHYTVHHDALANYQYHRVATVLVYLTDVPQGGCTVFPWVGMGVPPKKGRALVWYNVDAAGNLDQLMEHAACPVLLGDKWVINKWLFYGGQTFTVPCLDYPRARIMRPVS